MRPYRSTGRREQRIGAPTWLSPWRTPLPTATRLKADEPLVADDARVVARLDDVRLAGADLDLACVLVLHPSRPAWTTPTWRAWQLSVLATGWMHSDHRHPVANANRPAVVV